MAADDHVLLGEPRERDLDDREVAQQLLDHRRRHGGRVVGQPAHSSRAPEQHRGAEREHGGAGLESAGERAVGQAAEVEVVDLVAVLADDLADQAGPRVVPLTRGLGEEELPRAPIAPRSPAPPMLTSKRAEPSSRNVSRSSSRQAEQVADHQERDREREGLHQVDDAVLSAAARSVSSSWCSMIRSMAGFEPARAGAS